MRSLLDLSFRYKIPLWSGGLIVTVMLLASGAFMAQTYYDLRYDMQHSSSSLGRTLARSLFPAMLQDKVWHSFEIITSPLHGQPNEDLIQPALITVIDNNHRVFVSSQPRTIPMLTHVSELGTDYAYLSKQIAERDILNTEISSFFGTRQFYVAVPILEEGKRAGTLILAHDRNALMARFRKLAGREALIGLLILAVLLPINWYWGQRTAIPLVNLTRSMANVSRGITDDPPPTYYPYRDEIGVLFKAYLRMVQALREQASLKQGVIRTERLAAIGRLAAGIAHEINNPLGGMLVALNNFKRRGELNEHVYKTSEMIERGLTQIQNTVSALLVEARVPNRDFTAADTDDILALLSGQANNRTVNIQIDSSFDSSLPIPANPVRQIIINLLLNAIHAAFSKSTVHCTLRYQDSKLDIRVVNHGPEISPAVMDRLFEPFTQHGDTGTGLGLWVTYQLVSQLNGNIVAESVNGVTQFIVTLPVGDRL